MDKERSIDNLNKYGLSINLKRPMSFSESHITDLDLFTKNSLLNEFSPKLIIPLLSDKSQSKEINIDNNVENKHEIVNDSKEIEIEYKTFHYKDRCEMIINKLTLFLIHLFLISMFELIFFFKFVTKSEDTAILDVFGAITSSATQGCNGLNPQDKQILDYLLNSILNGTQLQIVSNQFYQTRMTYNNSLFNMALMFFLGLFGLNIFIFGLNHYYYKRKINFKGIITDNLVMITMLGVYEYIFFSYIVFRYQTTSPEELTYDIYQNVINSC
jgi:hypothetical protein